MSPNLIGVFSLSFWPKILEGGRGLMNVASFPRSNHRRGKILWLEPFLLSWRKALDANILQSFLVFEKLICVLP